jgi:hypothetical protein
LIGSFENIIKIKIILNNCIYLNTKSKIFKFQSQIINLSFVIL